MKRTWEDLVRYVNSKYKVAKQAESFLALVFETGNGRSQVVFLTRHLLMGGTEEWLQISSPIGDASKINLRAVLLDVGNMVCGGLAIYEDMLVIRDALPLAELDENEFERPLVLITTSADRLEKKYFGTDTV